MSDYQCTHFDAEKTIIFPQQEAQFNVFMSTMCQGIVLIISVIIFSSSRVGAKIINEDQEKPKRGYDREHVQSVNDSIDSAYSNEGSVVSMHQRYAFTFTFLLILISVARQMLILDEI